MPSISAGPEIERLIQLLARLPGLGPRSARRGALFLIKKRVRLTAGARRMLQTAIEKIEDCRVCGNIDSQNPCTLCTDPRRDPSATLVVADVADLRASNARTPSTRAITRSAARCRRSTASDRMIFRSTR